MHMILNLESIEGNLKIPLQLNQHVSKKTRIIIENITTTNMYILLKNWQFTKLLLQCWNEWLTKRPQPPTVESHLGTRGFIVYTPNSLQLQKQVASASTIIPARDITHLFRQYHELPWVPDLSPHPRASNNTLGRWQHQLSQISIGPYNCSGIVATWQPRRLQQPSPPPAHVQLSIRN